MSKFSEKYMQLAIDEAKKAFKIDEVPVGAVIVKEDKVIGRGYNTVIKNNSIIHHAEINAINEASEILGNYRLVNCQIYVTLEPCHMCAKAIVDTRLDYLFFGAREPKSGSIESVDKFLENKFLNHKVNYSGGHMELQSIEMLKKFFKSRRRSNNVHLSSSHIGQ
jgi:tRNA(adenine34) deaminase